jgi:hypothetical protein
VLYHAQDILDVIGRPGSVGEIARPHLPIHQRGNRLRRWSSTHSTFSTDMVSSGFYLPTWHVLNTSAECIYKKRWSQPSMSSSGKISKPSAQAYVNGGGSGRSALSAEDDAKLVFGTVFSLRNMVRKLGGDDDRLIHRYNCRTTAEMREQFLVLPNFTV